MTAGLKPTHPGEVLREIVLPSVGMSKAAIARLLQVSRQTLYDILNCEKPVTPQMALRLGKMFGSTPESWLRMQQSYDLAMIAPGLAEDLERIPELKAA
jgi:addiction module HigA family antidote